jgi:methylenetetrahydrofolate reductase (NADPH)
MRSEPVNTTSLRIDTALGRGRPIVSFEFFPPKTQEAAAQLFETIGELHSLRPSYVSVTYGAGGSTRRNTIEIVQKIQGTLDTRAMAHLTCVGHTREELSDILDELWAGGIRNVLALRGDPPADPTLLPNGLGELANAADLVQLARSRHNFCIAVAGYPECHPKCPTPDQDLDNLKCKVDQGASFIITQLFFDNADFYRFRDAARRSGIKVPIIAGIMPILNVAQIKKFVSLCGAKIPTALLERFDSVNADPQSVLAIGVDHSLNQCRELLTQGVDGLHFYTLNRSKATTLICLELQDTFANLGEHD